VVGLPPVPRRVVDERKSPDNEVLHGSHDQVEVLASLSWSR